MQSLDEPRFAMPVMDPLYVKDDYNPQVDDDVLDELDTTADLRVSSEYEDKFSDTGKCINYVRLKVI